jgi:hypothetical protein
MLDDGRAGRWRRVPAPCVALLLALAGCAGAPPEVGPVPAVTATTSGAGADAEIARPGDGAAARDLRAWAEAFARVFASEVPSASARSEAAAAADAARIDRQLAAAGVDLPAPQFVLLVDAAAAAQRASVFVGVPGRWHFVGSAPVSTGRVNGFEYFLTPAGVYAHTPANPDFRAEGTRNARGIRGYGRAGERVYDFGWVLALRTWDDRGRSPMRLQVHSTDPDRLAPRLGRRDSKGCVRIPSDLNAFIDRHGLLDADYLLSASPAARRVLHADRTPVPWPGRLLVIVDDPPPATPGR